MRSPRRYWRSLECCPLQDLFLCRANETARADTSTRGEPDVHGKEGSSAGEDGTRSYPHGNSLRRNTRHLRHPENPAYLKASTETAGQSENGVPYPTKRAPSTLTRPENVHKIKTIRDENSPNKKRCRETAKQTYVCRTH